MIAALALSLALALSPFEQDAQSVPVVEASPADAALAAFEPLLGKTWRGTSISGDQVIDEVRFDARPAARRSAASIRRRAAPIRATP